MTPAMTTAPTVREFLNRIFPDGTAFPIPETRPPVPEIDRAPLFPTDVFGAVALLIARSGAVSRLLIGLPAGTTPPSLSVAFDSMAAAVKAGGVDLNNPAVREEFRRAGREWASTLPVPDVVKRLWQQLVAAGNEPVHCSPIQTDPFPAWWTVALALLIISDDACDGIGYGPAVDYKKNWVSAVVLAVMWRKNERAYKAASGKKRTAIVSEDLPSLCFLADPDVVCVQPKVRTPAVGCTLRSYSHNVALLPPRGIVSTGWQNPPAAFRSEDVSSALNILIIPYPFSIRAKWFSGVALADKSVRSNGGDEWGWFHLKQEWLSDDIVTFTSALIREAENDVGTIHGVLFPEYALNWLTFAKIKDRMLTEFPNLEFLVAGSSTNCIDEPGNFVISAVFFDVAKSKARASARSALVSSRWKHHRWRLDEPQISNYALGSALDPRVLWWEAIALGPREIDFTVFRASSAFTTLICEDLARSDPCHGVLRDVGPNLVFVMLMDGPQLKGRWSARYSTTLADDPGSSVLTYTSLGLIKRSNESGRYDPSSVVGLWKDDTGKTEEIKCPDGNHGVVLSLSDATVSEMSLDGRCTQNARAWRFHSSHPVRIKAKTPQIKKSVGIVTGA